ncbi:MAG: tetraacyldisaccharide 4'-kinase [Bacteroidota bacterium]
MSSFRLLLLPVSWLYSLVLALRHFLYNTGVFKSHRNFGVPVICVGNLNLGGTGKTPFTEYLIRNLSATYTIGVVSRGYGRSTTGYLLADEHSTASTIGDEPLQLFSKNRIALAVCEDRTSGIRQLLHDRPEISLIILDDAFQHRKVSADVNILLSPWAEPFFSDHLLPAGNLRDIKSAAQRADMVVFTKTAPDAANREKILNRLPPKLAKNTWFSGINYLETRRPFALEIHQPLPENILVVTGIAKPEYLLDFAKSQSPQGIIGTLFFADHHKYTAADISKIASLFDTFATAGKVILTTEKDWVKLEPLLGSHTTRNHWAVAPIAFYVEHEDTFLASLSNKLAGNRE